MTTYVTSFINIDINNGFSFSQRFDKFMDIVNTDIKIHLFLDISLEKYVRQIEGFQNVKIQCLSLQSLWTYKICKETDYDLASSYDRKKDSLEYMILMNAKLEFLNIAINENIWNSEYFSWIDFNITHISNDLPKFQMQLKEINDLKCKFLAIPGCCKELIEDTPEAFDVVLWRFCGGFFIGDKESVQHFVDLFYEYFPIFLKKYNKITWEINFWAWLETNKLFDPSWYQADHNDSIINFPTEFYAVSLSNISTLKTYSYPKIEGFLPGSASYLKYNGKNILNTRFVNYSYIHNTFVVNDPDNRIITKNILSILDDHQIPLSYKEMIEPKSNNGLMKWNGIEDIRLYEYENEVRYIGTSFNHSTNERNLIVVGKYDIVNNEIIDCNMIEPPLCNLSSSCEKNWTPIIHNDNEYYIYKWSPMTIGKIKKDDDNNDRLHIEIIHNITSKTFEKFRGSTTFTRWGEVLIGVVHYSENEFIDRNYYHVLVMLDAETLIPLKYSQAFYFGEKPGIEFCTGFSIIDLKYNFWISQNDNNPLNISIKMSALPFSFDANQDTINNIKVKLNPDPDLKLDLNTHPTIELDLDHKKICDFDVIFCVFGCVTIKKYKDELIKIKETWGLKARKMNYKILFFLGEEKTDLIGEDYIYLQGVGNDYQSASYKQNLGLKHIYENYLCNFIYILGTDTYVLVDNLQKYLLNCDPKTNISIGSGGFRLVDNYLTYFHDGGAGIVISYNALMHIYPMLENMVYTWSLVPNRLLPRDPNYASDVCLCYYLNKTKGHLFVEEIELFWVTNHKTHNNIDKLDIIACHKMSIQDFDELTTILDTIEINI
jgi:hypothetical protein